jgi:hypothetical protein
MRSSDLAVRNTVGELRVRRRLPLLRDFASTVYDMAVTYCV